MFGMLSACRERFTLTLSDFFCTYVQIVHTSVDLQKKMKKQDFFFDFALKAFSSCVHF